MLLTRVILQDYGVYRGRNEFDFTCTQKKPIVLIGGRNGAGKTTLFESVMLCLYGMSAVGKRTTKKSYGKILARRIHRYLKSATTADHASITVQFKFYHNGREAEYRVERTWRRNFDDVSGIDEQLDIKKRSPGQDKFAPLASVEKSLWQSFIEDLIPRGIVKLFFFDGEKIARMAREGTEDLMIQESFKSLLGIDLVEQLRADLQVNLTRNLTAKGGSLQQDLENYKKEKAQLVDGTGRLREKLVLRQAEMDLLRTEIDSMEKKISRIGGGFASGRAEAKQKLAAKLVTYTNIQQRIAELCAGTLPFSMIPADLRMVDEQIQRDESIQQLKSSKKLLDSTFKRLNSRLGGKKFWLEQGLSREDAGKVASSVSVILKEEKKKPPGPGAGKQSLFGFSATQASRIKDMIVKANTSDLQSLKDDTAKLVEAGEEIDKLESFIANAPNDDEIGSLVSEIGRLNAQAGVLQAETDIMEQKISSNESMRQHLDVKIRDIISQIYKNEKSQRHVELTQSVQGVLEEFTDRLKEKKICLLEQYLVDAIRTLIHKKDFVEAVKVDPYTFEVSLFRKNDDLFPKDLLSEGEKQLMAMAVLWALAKTSGRPLPFMIDTPLARLDEEHRTIMVEQFIPAASHQVLVFSTDTEVEDREYKKLAPYLARSYVMEYVDEEGATKKHDGYFWDEEGKKVVAV